MCIKNLRERVVSEVRFRKTRLLHLGNVEIPPHSQSPAQRANKKDNNEVTSADPQPENTDF